MTKLELDIPPGATGGVIAVGNFDGVHLGHQQMLQRIVQAAGSRNVPAVVLTFDPHPINVLRPEVGLPRLTTIEERVRLLKKHGADHVVVLPTAGPLLSMSPREFFDEIVVGQLRAVGMVEGPDFRFGKDRAGDVAQLQRYCEGQRLQLTVIDAVQTDKQMVSSTRIRRAIGEGDVRFAASLLGRPYRIGGEVTSGAARGRELGYPTANLSKIPTLMPADGVYAGFVELQQHMYPVAVSVGANPTFADDQRKVECHVLDYSGDLYEQSLSVALLARLRDIRTFDDSGQLVQQIQADVQQTRDEYADFTAEASRL